MHTSCAQVCNRKGGSNRGYVAMGRGIQNPSHNYNGLIYEAITFPKFMGTSEIRAIANKLLGKYGMPVPDYAKMNNGYWSADKGVSLSGNSVTRWRGAGLDLVPPSGLAPVIALPKSARNSHPKYPAVDFQGKGTALVSTKMHASGCGDSWTYFVVVRPLVEIGWKNIFTTYDAPANSVNKACVEGGCTNADPYKYEPWSITEIGVHGWHSPDWHPGKLRMNQLQVVVYSTEKTKGLTINYYENGQAPREYTKKDFNQVRRL